MLGAAAWADCLENLQVMELSALFAAGRMGTLVCGTGKHHEIPTRCERRKQCE